MAVAECRKPLGANHFEAVADGIRSRPFLGAGVAPKKISIFWGRFSGPISIKRIAPNTTTFPGLLGLHLVTSVIRRVRRSWFLVPAPPSQEVFP